MGQRSLNGAPNVFGARLGTVFTRTYGQARLVVARKFCNATRFVVFYSYKSELLSILAHL